jgi:hypothetical protein
VNHYHFFNIKKSILMPFHVSLFLLITKLARVWVCVHACSTCFTIVHSCIFVNIVTWMQDKIFFLFNLALQCVR